MLRWFDGSAWTEHTAPDQSAWQTAPAPQPWQQAFQAAPVDLNGPGNVAHWMIPVGRSWQSILAGYLGLLSLGIWPLGPFAIGVGIWALVKARQGGHGRGRAITGIVGGAVGVAILLAFALSSA